MWINNVVRTHGFRNFMAKLYGWGASVVLIGALFKLQHYSGAGLMLIIGLGTEATIFFFSAFEIPHVEPDWSLVYPELAGMYHGGNNEEEIPIKKKGANVTQELDEMLKEAKIDQDLIYSLGKGLRNLNETTSKLSDISNISVANNEFIENVKSAAQNANDLSKSYKKTAETLDGNLDISGDYIENIKNASESVAKLSSTYNKTTESLKIDGNNYNEILQKTTNNLSALNTIYELQLQNSNEHLDSSDKFLESFSKFTKYLNESAENTAKYKDNLAALNAIYELQLKSSNEQLESSDKLQVIFEQYLRNLNDSVENTAKYKDNLAALNTTYKSQLIESNEQVKSTKNLHETINKFLSSINESADKTVEFKNKIDILNKNITSLNDVYGKMLTAMNVNINS